MDERFSPRPIAGWFIAGAVASLLFMGLGCISYLMHVFANPATMPLDQRAAYEAEPAWVTGAYAVAVWVGLIGAVLLMLRRRAAEWLLLLSLLAVLVWLAGLVLVTQLRENMSANDLLVAIVVTALLVRPALTPARLAALRSIRAGRSGVRRAARLRVGPRAPKPSGATARLPRDWPK